jgi:hypothetical protein
MVPVLEEHTARTKPRKRSENPPSAAFAARLEDPLYALCFYVPESHVEEVKQAVFDAGAGRIGDYDCCAWQVLGTGQFRPMQGSQPFLGQQDQLERVAEFRVEMVCDDPSLEAAVRALRDAHPYEEPAFHYWPVHSSLTP